MVLKHGKTVDFAKCVKNNIDNKYGAGIIEYIYQWAYLLEDELRKRSIEVNKEYDQLTDKEKTTILGKMKEFVKSTEGMADTMGMSGASFGFGLKVMKECWIWGELLSELYDERGFYKGNKK